MGQHLASLPTLEGQIAETQGAPSVALAKNEKDVMLLVENPANVVVFESLGLVTAHRAIARRFFRVDEAEAKLKNEMLRANEAPAASHFELLLKSLTQELQKKVMGQGGNALLGVKLEIFPESQNMDPST